MSRRPAFDYHARTAQAPTFPKMLRLNAREHGGEVALREKDFDFGSPSPGISITRAPVISRLG